MKNDLQTLLHQKGHKATKPRLAILGAFSKDCAPMSAEKIHQKVKKSGMDLVTVYRTLSLFEKDGIIRRVDLHKEAVFYELNDDHHHHLVCNNCGKIEDFESGEIERATKKILAESSKFKKATDHSFEIFGVCKTCARV